MTKMKFWSFIKENAIYSVFILLFMFIGSVYFAAVGGHPVLFLIFSSPFLLFVVALGFGAILQFISLFIHFFKKSKK